MMAGIRRLFGAAMRRDRGRRLRLCETLSLGDKRFLMLVECDRRGYLLAGAADHISLLRCLELEPEQEHSVSPQLDISESWERKAK